MSIFSENEPGVPSLSLVGSSAMQPPYETESLSIADATSRVEYSGPLAPNDFDGVSPDSALAAQWVRQLVACYSTEGRVNLAHPVTPNTLIPVIYWSTFSTQDLGKENIELVPLRMLAQGVDAFRETYSSPTPDRVDPMTTQLGNEHAPYRWHMRVFWGDVKSDEALSEKTREHLKKIVPPDVLKALEGLNDALLDVLKKGMPQGYKGFESLDVDMDCGLLEQNLEQGSMDDALPRSERYRRSASAVSLKPISLLANGIRFQPHRFADQWLSQRGLTGDAQVQVTYQEVETVDSTAETKNASVPLRDAVTQGFLSAYQSKTIHSPSALTPREGWIYPYRSHMSLDFSSLRVNGRALSPDVLRQLQAGIPPGYQGTGQPVITELDAQGNLISAQVKEQVRQLELLDINQVKLARLFAGLPTFDTMLKNLLSSRIKGKIPKQKFRASLPQNIDPDIWYVNHFTTDSIGGRSLTSSESFTNVMWECLVTDATPNYSAGSVGFFIRPDAVEEADSVFVSPVDTEILRAMQSAFYITHPPTNDSVKRQVRDELTLFRHNKNRGDALDTSTSSTAEAALAHLLSRRFLHLFDLYKADQGPANQLSQTARAQQREENRLLDIITAHPSMADRSRLLRAPIPLVYAVMLDMGTATPQKWPAAMVIKQTDQSDRPSLFLYSLDGGIQRFNSFEALVDNVRPTYKGQERTIRDISCELTGHVFEVAADDLLQIQRAALETVLTAPENETVALRAFAENVEDALGLPMLSLAGPLTVRGETLVENNRPMFYKTAIRSQKVNYRNLEAHTLQAVYEVANGIPKLLEFTRQKVKEYLRKTVHSGIDPDPDKTMVTLSYIKVPNPALSDINNLALIKNIDPNSRQSRVISLSQLMLENIGSVTDPSVVTEVLTVYLADQDGQRIRHPANGYFITLTWGEVARMVKSIDVGGSYKDLLREKLNTPEYKTAWQTAYLANMKFKGYEAALRGDEVFKATLKDKAFNPPMSKKQVALWLDAVLKSSTAETRALVMGRRVHLYGLWLGRSEGALNGVSVDGALIFSDQDGPNIKGTVGVYFPDSPEGNDFHEFSDLGDGVAGLLQQKEWQEYFRSRISILDPDDIKNIFGLRGPRPVIRGWLISGDLLEALHRAHVNACSAYVGRRSQSNQDVRRQNTLTLGLLVYEVVLEVAMFLVPGFQMLRRAIKTGLWMLKTGGVELKQLKFITAYYKGRGPALEMAVPLRGQSSFLAVTARQSQGKTLAGLPLEEAIYSRYAVADTSVIQGLAADAQGFYRATVNNTTGSVTARPVYVRQPDGTVFRVHGNTKLKASEATIVDPDTGLSIRSSGVMRSTVARMPNGEWRAVGFGQGGGKRPATSPPGSSEPKVPAISPSAVSNSIRTAGSWDNQIMDLVPSIVTRLPSWPANRSLLIIDEIAAGRGWSVRFTPGQVETIYPMNSHPDRSGTDIVLRRTAQNHYSLIQGNRVVDIPADGDCFFNAISRGLNEGQAQGTFSIQGLRNEAADYINRHPEVSNYLAPPASAMQQALFDNAPPLESLLGREGLFDLNQIISGSPNPHHLFPQIRDYLRQYANRQVLTEARGGVLPPEILQKIARLLEPRSPTGLPSSIELPSTQDKQSVQSFFENFLQKPIQNQQIAALLDNQNLVLSQDVTHIILEYGVSANQLSAYHPKSRDAYVQYDEATHGHLDGDELEELLDGAHLVDSDNLADVAKRYKDETGKSLYNDSELFDQFIYYAQAEGVVDLLRAALEGYPDLQRRTNILLTSPVISSNLGGMVRVNEIARWVRNPALSDKRLQIISEYASTRYDEVVATESIDINWMQPFDDQNLRSIFTHQTTLEDFLRFLRPPVGTLQNIDMSAVAKLFGAPEQLPSNTRVALLFNTPDIWGSIQRLPRDYANQIWSDLIGPQFSDVNIRQALGRPGSLRTALDFAAALRDSLGREEARANGIIQRVLSITQSRAQQYLYNFDFPSNRLGHSRLDFAVYLESYLKVPDWAWQYARKGVTPDSLKSFLKIKPKSV